VNIASASFLCSSQTGRGKIVSRAEELAGPEAITGGGNAAGYMPCYYTAPVTGIYDVAMSGPNGFLTTSTTGGPLGDIGLISPNNFTTAQNSTVAAWDVTVRSGVTTGTTDIDGRLFAYYYALFTGANNRPINFSLYPVTNDGYRYRVTLQGLDPNGFLLYGNQAGFFDSDGKTPLYHNVIGNDSQLTSLTGGVSLARPQFATFLNDIASNLTVLNHVKAIGTDGNVAGTGIVTSPIVPTINSLVFAGNVAGNASLINQGGTFTFNSTAGVYEIVISRNGTNFDPTNPNNRVLRGVLATAGSQSVTWNGLDNSGNAFPVGYDYPTRVTMHGGEYHFPLLDAENNITGGPRLELLNGTNPIGNTQIFFDDRGYRTLSGTTIGTIGTSLCATPASTLAFPDPVLGVASGAPVRQFGNGTGCPGAFGDLKGLDLWTFSPSATQNTPVTILPVSPRLRLVKRMTAVHVWQPDNTYTVTPLTGFNDVTTGTNAADDNIPRWVTTPTPYLQGIFNQAQVPASISLKPKDQVEYTIYFLSDGGADAQGVNLCDYVPQNSAIVPGSIVQAFGTSAPTPVADATGFFATSPTTAPASNACSIGVDNGQGAVVVNIGTAARSSGVGTPNNSYGYFRFRAQIK
jgi:hypothetical protein